jgi:hypothetical protein
MGFDMAGANILPDAVQAKVNAMPESGYGVTRVTVVLDDGKRYSDVHVAWGREIVKVGRGKVIPFDVSRIVDVEPFRQ